MEYGAYQKYDLPLLCGHVRRDTPLMRMRNGIMMEMQVMIKMGPLVFAHHRKELKEVVPLKARSL
jgi:hypothetical protein